MRKRGIQIIDEDGYEIYPNPYPVGAIYMSVDSRNPSQIFGGTWEQIKGQYLLGVDEQTAMPHKSAGKNIGDWNTNSHTLTINEMPSHSHALIKNVPYGMPYNDTGGVAVGNGGGTFYRESYNPFGIENNGGNQGHSHGQFIPPSFTVYIWRRVE